MPEGHTIHRIARRHRDLFVGESVAVSSPQGRFREGAALLDGRGLSSVEAFGKNLMYDWDGGDVLQVHLGLIGTFRTFAGDVPGPTANTRLVFETAAAAAYLSGPMTCRVISPGERDAVVAGLGPDPLRTPRRGMDFAANLSRRKIAIGAALLDQAAVAGIGNVFRSELLYRCGIHPGTRASGLDGAEVDCLWQEMRTELRRGVRTGRIVTVDPGDVGRGRRASLEEDERRYVYKRHGMPCHRCGTIVERQESAGRWIWWCPECQPARRGSVE